FAHPKARYLDRIIEMATRQSPCERPTMAELATELSAVARQAAEPVSPGDLSNILAGINQALEPTLQAERARRSYIRSAAQAIAVFEERLGPMAQVFASVPGFIHDFSRRLVSFISEPTDGRRLVWGDSRGWELPQR